MYLEAQFLFLFLDVLFLVEHLRVFLLDRQFLSV